MLFGSFALLFASRLIVKENAWGLAVVDLIGIALCIIFLFVPRIRYEIRVFITLIAFYAVGMAVILSFGPLSGGPAWLFAFAVLSGVLIGNHAAFIAILMNTVFLSIIGTLIYTGKFGTEFPFFNSQQAMISSGVNFIVLNAITAISVSSLVKGLLQLYTKRECLTCHLEEERLKLIKTKLSLESEIQDRKQTEAALKKSETLSKLITENTSAFVSIHDSNTNYIFASPSHEALGFKPEELIGQSGFTLMVEEDIEPISARLDDAQKRKISKAFLNYRIKDKNGKIHYFSGSFDAVFNPDGSLKKIICVGEDLTELRKAQSEKVEALSLAAKTEKFALVGQIAGKMAHDFNNILGVIMGNAELALFDCPDDQTSKSLELIFEQTIRGKNLTKNLVAFAKDQEPKQEFFSIDKKMELVIKLLKKDLEGINVIRQYNRETPELLADPGMIEHAIVNLVQNSIHATSLVKRPEIILRTYPMNERIILEIEDNGCGIPPEVIGKIFEPSFTLKGSKDKTGMYKPDIKGTGYGMSNVTKYIEQHKGSVSIHSELEKGTKVVINLPVIKKELTTEEIEKIKKETIFFGKNILLVEDEQSISDVQHRILTHEPCRHKVDVSSTGQDAMDLFGKNEYDFVSLDYVLPEKFNGMDVYHHIRKTDKNIPILFISGNLEFIESIRDLKKKDPYIDHLSKPCMNLDYLNSINKLLGKLTSLASLRVC